MQQEQHLMLAYKLALMMQPVYLQLSKQQRHPSEGLLMFALHIPPL
jgi:hypothetical protein